MPLNLDDPIDQSILDRLNDEVGPALPMLVGALLKEMLPRAERIAEAARTGDTQTVAQEAHILTSTSASFGAWKVAECARTIEEAYRGNHPDVLTLCADLPALAQAAEAGFRQRGYI